MRAALGGLVVVGLLASMPAVGAAEGRPGDALEPEVVVAFDESAGHLPEGVAVDRRGNLFVSLGPPFFVGGGYGEIRRIGPDGGQETLVELPDGPAPAGVAVTRGGTVYFAVPDPEGEAAGVYRVTANGPVRVPGTEEMRVPNGLAVGRFGAVYATDSLSGSIWRIPRRGVAEAWLSHDLLAGCTGDQVGANGIAFWRGDLYVANTSRGTLVRVPVSPWGEPSTPELVAGDDDCDDADELFGMDGIAFDVRGQVYALLVLRNELVRIDPRTGSSVVLLDEADGLWNGASLAFGTRRGDRRTLYISNYAVLPPRPASTLGPAILEVDIGVPGAPLGRGWCGWRRR